MIKAQGDKAMAVKLFKLRNVPEDETEEIRQLLQQQEIAFYETEAGGWGVSVPAIWLHDASQFEQASALIDDYQRQRLLRARAAYQLQKDERRHVTMADKIRQQPLQAILFFLMSLFILYVSLAPFIDFS